VNRELPADIVAKANRATIEHLQQLANLLSEWSVQLGKIADRRLIQKAIRDGRGMFPPRDRRSL